jgi:hypothetical protein
MVARALLLALALLAAVPCGAADDVHVVVIVHPERQAALSKADLAQVFLRRKRFWEDGSAVVPLNLPSGTALRNRFARAVLGETEERLADYWNKQYFYGVLPPPTLASSEAIRRYVASDRNAIGYLPAADVDDSVRVLLHIE